MSEDREQATWLVGFLNETIGAALHGFDGHRDIAMGRHHDNGELHTVAVQSFLKFKALDSGHTDVNENNRIASIQCRQLRKKLFTRLEDGRVIIGRF